MKANVKEHIFAILLLLLLVSCKLNKDMKGGTNPEQQNYYDEMFTINQIEVLDGAVTIEILETIIGKIDYDYTPVRSAYVTHMYKGIENKNYEIEFIKSDNGDCEVVACRLFHEDESILLFCKTNSEQYWMLNIKVDGI